MELGSSLSRDFHGVLLSRSGSAIFPVHPRTVSIQQVFNLFEDVLVAIATCPHLRPECHPFIRGDSSMRTNVNLIEHRLHTDVAESSFEEIFSIESRNDHGIVGIHGFEELLTLLPCLGGQPAKNRPSWKLFLVRASGGSAIFPIHPRAALHEFIQLIEHVLILVSRLAHLDPKRHELLRGDRAATIYIHLVEHGLSTKPCKGTFEESSRLFSSHSVAAIHIHHAEELLEFPPGFRRDLTTHRSLWEWFPKGLPKLP
mmetsp:Transcript_72528/g.135490  ORF Transcript_72528/g.135490 Transcript_72528/m.135490 type:complete len:257 (-) Transcript_72528:106-876(-)